MKLKDILEYFKDVEFEETLLEELEKHRKYTVWTPVYEKPFYRINDRGDVIGGKFFDFDYQKKWIKIGNVFETKEQAEEELAKRKAIVKVNKAIVEINQGWEPDWEETRQDKICIVYDMFDYAFRLRRSQYSKFPNFLNFIESEKKAEKIIKEYTKELKIIFDVED